MQPCALVIFFKSLLLKGACQKNRSVKFSVYLKKVELDLMSLTSNLPEARFCYPDSVHTPEMVMNLDTTSDHWMLINRLHLSPTYYRKLCNKIFCLFNYTFFFLILHRVSMNI